MRILSGIQPSGSAHIGNYFGYLKHNIDLLGQGEVFLMIADLHALTTVHDPDELRQNRQELVKDFIACGFDPEKGALFFQSNVPEHAELAWVLSCVTPMGLLERAVSYKEKVQMGLESNAGLFTYPVLQAADIFLYNADTVPVGKDQQQHLEIARDIAMKFNHRYGENLLTVPAARIREDVAVVPGIDGRKMSKSYGNTIPLFGSDAATKKAIMGIVTDSKGASDPKDPDACPVYQIHKLFLSPKEAASLADAYRSGLSYGDAKKKLLTTYMDYFRSMREKRDKIKAADVQDVIEIGGKSAKAVAMKTMAKVRVAVGLL